MDDGRLIFLWEKVKVGLAGSLSLLLLAVDQACVYVAEMGAGVWERER